MCSLEESSIGNGSPMLALWMAVPSGAQVKFRGQLQHIHHVLESQLSRVGSGGTVSQPRMKVLTQRLCAQNSLRQLVRLRMMVDLSVQYSIAAITRFWIWWDLSRVSQGVLVNFRPFNLCNIGCRAIGKRTLATLLQLVSPSLSDRLPTLLTRSRESG